MPEENESGRVNLLIGAIILLRVAAVLVIWVALFLAVFLGYFTVPILLVGGLTVVYAVTDAGLYVAMKREAEARKARRAFVVSQKGAHPSHRVD
jgi:hypothetical protein